MKFELNEYNVASNVEERDSFVVKYENDMLIYNNEIITDKDKINSICNLLEKYKDDIIKLGNERISNYKGGRQEILNIQFNEIGNLHIFGNTPSSEMANLYSILKNEIVKIIEQ